VQKRPVVEESRRVKIFCVKEFCGRENFVQDGIDPQDYGIDNMG